MPLAPLGPSSSWETFFQARIFSDSLGHRLPFRLLLPPTLSTSELYPLVVLLHGAGERGEDNLLQLGNGLGRLLIGSEARTQFPCIAVVPQCPVDARWVEVDWTAERHVMPTQPSVPLGALLQLLDVLVRSGVDAGSAVAKVDLNRIYAVGLSMGGFGVWDLLSRRPQLFAAGVPICGGADEAQARRLRSLPLWVFHGGLDPVVKPQRSRQMVAALRAEGAAPRYTEYAEVGHDSWVKALQEPELLPWLFGQIRVQ